MIFEDLFRNPLHLMTLLVIVVLIMGGSRLTDTMGSVGKGIKEFKKNIKDDPEPSAASTQVPVAATSSGAAMAIDVSQNANAVRAIQCASCSSTNPLGSKLCNQCGSALA